MPGRWMQCGEKIVRDLKAISWIRTGDRLLVIVEKDVLDAGTI